VLPAGGYIWAEVATTEHFLASPSDRRVCWLDEDVLDLPLRIRYPQRGDRFHPLGAPAPTRLSEFFIRQKVPERERSRTPLVLSGDQIIWVAGLRSAEAGKLTPGSRRVVRLELKSV
jgi:tRNA(Ile)-lysidine synthase